MSEEDLAQRITNLENDMMLVRDGSIVEHISEAIHWKATTKTLTGGTDYTADGAWTDLSLKAWTSNKAKYAILGLYQHTTATAGDMLRVRKNGETPVSSPTLYCMVAGRGIQSVETVAMDTSQTIEYFADDASDTYILVLGYIE